MKFIISLLLLSFFLLPCFGQKRIPPNTLYDSESKKIKLETIHQVEGATKSQLYANGKQWFANTFKSANDVIQMDDRESGKLIGKGFSKIEVMSLMGSPVATRMFYTVSIFSKEGRYKIMIEDVYYMDYPSGQYPNPQRIDAELLCIDRYYKKNGKVRKQPQSFSESTMKEMLAIESSIKAAMQKSNSSDDEDDW